MNPKKLYSPVLFSVIAILFCFSLTSAVGPPPPHKLLPPEYPPGQRTSPGLTDSGKLSFEPYAQISSPPGDVEGLTLGTPGLIFRYNDRIGITEQAYSSTTGRINRPDGLYIDSSNTLFVATERGCRLLAYYPAGTNALSIGTAGLCYSDDNGQVLSQPRDVVKDGDGNIWLADAHHRVIQYDSGGSTIQTLPEENTWESGTDNTHFNGAMGIAFDSTDRMFVADRWNHRIQVYTFSSGDPVYDSTIGVTGVSGSDNSHFNEPWHLVVDSSDRLYVVDRENHRIQRCEESTSWSCSTFATGLSYPGGVGIDASDNIYIADSGNARIIKCTSGGSCGDLVTGFPGWVADIAVDSTGNVFASDWNSHTVRKYNSSGVDQGIFVGIQDLAYPPDTAHVYTPNGIGLAADGSIYVTEKWGYLLRKYNSAGSHQWYTGIPAVFGTDNSHFGAFWEGPQGSIGVDASGQVYVPDLPNNRIQIFNSSGVYQSTFGSYGSGSSEFDGPAAVAIHSNGDIYVVDRWNHRVQIYDNAWTLKYTLGTTGVSGTSSSHFNGPSDVAVASDGTIYVADSDNHRVQVCTLVGGVACSTFAGQVNDPDYDFDHFAYPAGVAVDSHGRVYVADQWNNRIQVFDNTGAYLTTIGGEWGSETGQLRGPSDVAVDATGFVYVADTDNHRVQIFIRGIGGWEQTNINGFGDVDNEGVISFAAFGSYLYAGTFNDAGGEIWRSTDGESWTNAMSGGFGSSDNVYIDHLYAYGGDLYAGTGNMDETHGAEMYRSSDGTTWNPITTNGFGDVKNAEIFRFAEFSGNLYASTWSWDPAVQGGEIWRSASGNSGSWSLVVDDGMGDSDNIAFASFETHGGYFYAGSGNKTTGGEVWRSTTGNAGSWTQINIDGFGSPGNSYVSALELYDGYLYAITHHTDGDNAEIWRCQTCDGTDWSLWITGFSNQDSRIMPGLEVHGEILYAVIGNGPAGLEVWRGLGAYQWNQIGYVGMGDSNNNASYFDNAITVFDDHMYFGTYNFGNGGEIWRRKNPEIHLEGNGQPIPDGDMFPSATDDTEFGDADIGVDTIIHTFTIENNGETILLLVNTPYVEITGANAGDFSVTSQPASSIPAGGSTTFDVTFDPLAAGLRQAEVYIESDDHDELFYNFAIQGTGVVPIEPDTMGLYDPAISQWQLKHENSAGSADLVFAFGPGGAGWQPVVGDWDNDGVDTIGLYNPATSKWYLKNANGSGPVDTVFRFGPVGMGWIPIAGDWDNDGMDTVGFYSPITSKFYLRNAHAAGAADVVFRFGPAGMGWLPYAGDWDNDGVDSVGLYNPITSKFYFRNSHTAGAADVVFRFGVVNAGWLPVAGDWDDDGFDTVALYKPANSKWYLRNSATDGPADLVFQFGPASSTLTPLAGLWD